MLKRFIQYYKPFKVMFALDMLASFFISVIGMIYPIVTRKMLNDLIPNQDYRMVVVFGVFLFGLYFVRMLLKFFVQYYGHIIGVHMQANMRKDLFHKLERLPFSYYDQHETGQIMTHMTSDLFDVSELAHHGPENLIISTVMIVFSFLYLSSINISLTLIIFSCIPLLFVISTLLKNKMRLAFKEAKKSVGVINGSLQSSITGIRVTRAFNNEFLEEKKFEKGNVEFVKARSKAYKSMGLFHSTTSFITDIFNVICLVAGGIFLYRNEITFGDYSAFIVSINLFIGPVTTLIGFMEQYQNGMSGFERFIEILDQEEEMDHKDAQEYDLKGNITFKEVSFAYEQRKILDNISFHVPLGKTLALVGPSGGGKTTICHLIPNFYAVSSGEILIDDIPIYKIKKASLRRQIGIVQQDVFLFNGTILDNLLYGRLDATMEEVIQASKDANIYEYIMSLPDGFDSQVGERGVKLSGGQKQRLSIARVFLKNPKILILDEATSALDNTTELLIQSALDRLTKGRTTIVVAHRLSTIKHADEIALVVNGSIQEYGKHEELMLHQQGYATLYNLQFKDDELASLNQGYMMR